MNCVQKLTSGFVVVVSLVPLLASAGRKSGKNERRLGPASSAQIARGQMVFEQNCSRCHNAPQAFPPRISATMIRHMRVRASLSAADEKALLRFVNP
jgi:cytochrome c5